MDRFTDELVEAGIFVARAGLRNTGEARRIAIDGGSRTVIDGPFAEARELIAGFSTWQVNGRGRGLTSTARSIWPPRPGSDQNWSPRADQAILTLPRRAKGPIAPPPALAGKLKAVANAVAAWPDVEATVHWRFDQPSRVDGVDFYVGSDELGHIPVRPDKRFPEPVMMLLHPLSAASGAAQSCAKA